eukprot:gene34344-39118_t
MRSPGRPLGARDMSAAELAVIAGVIGSRAAGARCTKGYSSYAGAQRVKAWAEEEAKKGNNFVLQLITDMSTPTLRLQIDKLRPFLEDGGDLDDFLALPMKNRTHGGSRQT